MTNRQLAKYIFFDVLSALLAWLLSYLYRRLTNDFPLSSTGEMSYIAFSFQLGLSAIGFVAIVLFFNYLTGSYVATAHRLRITEFFSSFISSFLSALTIYFIFVIDDEVVSYRSYYQSFFVLWSLLFIITFVVRCVLLRHMLGPVSVMDISIQPLREIVPMQAWQQAVKRLFDIVVSVFSLIILSPVCLYLIIRIRLDSEGSAFYSQERIGKNGKPFMILKFRSMYVDAEISGPALTMPDDERITPFGRVMRKYRLDEIPQFVNILKGDMSVVGPRPERRYYINEIEKVAPQYNELLSVRPGLLSWGPIKVGYSDSTDKMVKRLEYDLDYLNNMTLSTDIRIIILSVRIIILGKGQ